MADQNKLLYVVVGGVWKSTDWQDIDCANIKMFGPYEDEDTAVLKWRGIAQSNVDDAHHRVFVARIIVDTDMTVFALLGNGTSLSVPFDDVNWDSPLDRAEFKQRCLDNIATYRSKVDA